MSAAVVACGTPPNGPVLQGDAPITVVPDLCNSPRRLVDVAAGASSLVLLVHPHDVELPGLQAAMRKAGFDPFGVPLVDITAAGGDRDRLDVMISGAVARSRAFASTRPEQARPVMPREMSRRALLTFPRPYYEAVPAIDAALCAAADGCRACVESCPEGAYRTARRRILFDKNACVTCGLCVTACPTGAIDHPSLSPEGIRAEVAAIVAAADSAGVVFTCFRSSVPVTAPGWYAVAVPCTGMVPATWPVAAVLMGAAASAIRPCREGGCPIGHDEKAGVSAAFGRELVIAGGLDPGLVPDSLVELRTPPPGSPVALVDPFGIHGAAEVVLALASLAGKIELESAPAPLGIVAVDPETCTLCTMCAITCPTGALEARSADGRLSLTFDANVCTACEQCLRTCPEANRGAISVHAAADSAALEMGRRVVHDAAVAVCAACGRVIAPEPALDRVAALLGDGYEATLNYVRNTCMDCRGLITV